MAIVVLADVLIRRRDLGRRRTLGIGRGDLILLVAVRTAVPALLGAVLGSGAGYAVVAGQGGTLGVDFVAAVAVLAALTALLASLAPAAFADVDATNDYIAANFKNPFTLPTNAPQDVVLQAGATESRYC